MEIFTVTFVLQIRIIQSTFSVSLGFLAERNGKK